MNQQDHAFRLDHQFEQQARRTPDSVALYSDGASITFAQLAASADRFLAVLSAAGVADGGVVGVHVERSPNYVACVLAVLKANCAVVPLPPSYPQIRLRDILAFAALDAVVDDEQTPLDPKLTDRIIRFSDAREVAVASEQRVPASPDQAAFVLCSSGSTGTPKMIVRSHRSFFHRLQWTWTEHPYEPGETCCQKSYMATTHAVYELFEPLLRGIPVCLVSDQHARSLEAFWETVAARSISRLLVVPSVLQASLDMPGFVAPPLRVLVLMGEYVHAKLAARAIAAFPAQTKIYSIYGSTEASSTLVCDIRASFRAGEELPLGKPIAKDVGAYVLRDDLEPVQPGEVGMLHIAGTPVFTGYFKDPVLTASVVATAPNGNERLYNTHDQVRRMADGSLCFVGRIDHTVKIRGFRVDLQEVERALLLHADVRECAAILSDGEPERARLLAFVAPEDIAQQGIFDVLGRHLPAYMIPSALIGMPSLPRTANGKIDRQALLADYAARGTARPASACQSETERRIAAVWKDVLQLESVRADCSFFELGGTSLSVFAVVYRLRDAFGLDRDRLSDVAIYRYPTVQALASYIDRMREGTAAVAPATQPILVTLKSGDDAIAPVFAISSAGGTLGAYDKLVKALATERAVIGVRDPFVWGARDASAGFQHWVGLYVDAIRARQPHGPYYLLAYSSAAAFGYEIAQHLLRGREEVALLALVDPLAMDRSSKQRFGYWALRARYMRPLFARAVLLGGWLRLLVPRWLRDSGRSARRNDHALTKEQIAAAAKADRTNKENILVVSALLELNTERPFALGAAELSTLEPEQYLGALLSRVKSVAPEIDPQMIENVVTQYNLQVRAQHRYRVQRFDGNAALFHPAGPGAGLLAAQFRPYLRNLRVRAIAVGTPSERTRRLAEAFPAGIRSHYLSMRDEPFVKALAAELGRLLRPM